MGLLGLLVATGTMGLMTYSLMNKSTSKKANMLVNDMLTKTDDLIKGK